MKFMIREVEAWASTEEGLWDYNNVWNIGILETRAKNEKRAIADFLRKNGIVFKKARTLIWFDGDNYEIVDRKTKEPLFDAIFIPETEG